MEKNWVQGDLPASNPTQENQIFSSQFPGLTNAVSVAEIGVVRIIL